MRIAVVGAGVTGLTVARSLIRRGLKPHIFDKRADDTETAASHIAAGMLAPLLETEFSPPNVFIQGLKAIDAWEETVAELDCPQVLERKGSLVVYHRQEARQFEQLVRLLRSKVGDDAFDMHAELVEGDSLRALEPELNEKFQRGLYVRSEAQINARPVLRSMQRWLNDQGAEFFYGRTVRDLQELQQGENIYDLVVDCRGMGSLDDIPLKLRGLRGEVLRIQAANLNYTRPIRVLHPRYPLYVAPKKDGEFIVGATMIENQKDHAMTLRSCLELGSAVYSLDSRFSEARLTHLEAGVRPTLEENCPKIIQKNRVFYVNGMYRHGFLLAPLLAEQVGDKVMAELETNF